MTAFSTEHLIRLVSILSPMHTDCDPRGSNVLESRKSSALDSCKPVSRRTN